MPPRLTGTLSLYPLPSSAWARRPYFTSGDEGADRAVVFIGGLHAGLLDAPFLVPLSRTLGASGWRLVQMHWSGAYDGFGSGSLARDCDEMEALVGHLQAEGVRLVVIAGHSTGAQDVLHYLTSARRSVGGGILVSPASDREYYEMGRDAVWTAQLEIAQRLIKDGRGDTLLDDEMTRAFGARVTAYRLHNLIGVGGEDDYFSSDIPDTADGVHAHPLSESFGRLSVPVRALWMENDHCASLPDQRVLLRRWEVASGGKLSWNLVEGATHSVEEEEAQAVLCEDVCAWLLAHFG